VETRFVVWPGKGGVATVAGSTKRSSMSGRLRLGRGSRLGRLQPDPVRLGDRVTTMARNSPATGAGSMITFCCAKLTGKSASRYWASAGSGTLTLGA
jgi:hypothetical protein